VTQDTSAADAVRAVVTKLVLCLVTPDADLGPVGTESDLRQDLGYQSLMLVELGFTLQDLFDIAVDGKEVAQVRTLGDVTEVVLRQIEAGVAHPPSDDEVRDWLESYGYDPASG
jgi:acyl carrier protein